MPCPHHQSTDDDGGIERRDFVKTALAIGGAKALASVEVRAHGNRHERPPTGTDDPASLSDRQYAWNDFVPRNDDTGQAKTPKHHLQFMLSYDTVGTPTEADREQVEAALRSLERAFEWSNDGLLFTLGYSPAYFERFDADLPPETGLRPPEDVVEESDIRRSGPVLTEQSDVHVHLASDTVVALLQAEQALFGDRGTVNGVAGHAQKLARAREEDGTPPILRRDFPSTDGHRVHTQFVSNHRTIDDFIRVREAMAFVDPDADPDFDRSIPDFDEDSRPDDHVNLALPQRAADAVSAEDHGIQGHFRVQRRGTYLVPPRDLRALPPARSGTAGREFRRNVEPLVARYRPRSSCALAR